MWSKTGFLCCSLGKTSIWILADQPYFVNIEVWSPTAAPRGSLLLDASYTASFLDRLYGRMRWNLWSGGSFEILFVQTTLRTIETRLQSMTDDDFILLVYLFASPAGVITFYHTLVLTRKYETSNSKGYFQICVVFILQYFSSSAVLVEKRSTFGGRAERTTQDMRWEMTEDDWWSRWSNVLHRQTYRDITTNWPYYLGVGTRFLQLHPPDILQQVYTRGWSWYPIPRPSGRKPATSVGGWGRSFLRACVRACVRVWLPLICRSMTWQSLDTVFFFL